MARAGARRFLPTFVGLSSFVLILAVVEFLIRIGVINRYIVPLPSEVAKSFGRVIVEEDILHRFLLTGWECLAAGVLLTVFGVAIGVLLHRCRCFAAPARPGSPPWRRRRWCWPIRCSWCCSAGAR